MAETIAALMARPLQAGILLARHQDNTIVLHWQQKDVDTGDLATVDATQYGFVCTLLSETGTVWHTFQLQGSEDGYVSISINHQLLEQAVWDARMLGTYRVDAIKNDTGLRFTLAQGELRII